MHIPSGLVSEQINIATAVVSAGAVGYCLWKVKRTFEEKPSELLRFAMVSAFIFAMQTLNFSIGGGTSGHFLGGLFAAAMLGPWAACLSLTAVLTVQSVFFGDGALAALGSNVLNMGVVGVLLAYPLLQALQTRLPATRTGHLAALGLVSWVSIVLASAACAVELALSGTSSAGVVFPAMVGTHALIGLAEAVLTVIAVQVFANLSSFPALQSEKRMAMAGFALAAVLVVFVSPLASQAPDGLERFVLDQGLSGVTF